MNFIKKLLPLIIIILLSFWAIKPLFMPGFFPMHDNVQPSRVFEMANALKDGMFPVRWSSDLGFGYGYPLFNYYAPFAYYLGAIFNLVGFNALEATKIMMALGFIVSAFSMYIFAKEFFGKYAAIIASIFYVYAPYHAVDIYVRGDVSEFWAYAFIPFVFWGLYKIYKENKFKYTAFTAISFALLILSHNLTAFIVAPFILTYSVYFFLKKRNIMLVYSLGIGVLLSSFYSLPAIAEIPFFNVMSQIGVEKDFQAHFACLSQLWSSQWGFGGSVPGCVDGISFMIGKYHILSAVLAFLLVFIFYIKKKLSKDVFENILIFSIFTIIGIFLTTSFSLFVWKTIYPMKFIQFPWRFLIIISFTISFVGSSFFYLFKKRLSTPIYIIFTLFVSIAIVFVYSKFFVPQETLPKTASDYVSIKALNYDISKISHEFMPKNFVAPKNINEISNFRSIENKNIDLVNITKTTNKVVLNLNVSKKTEAIIPIAYFPAWKAYVNGSEIPILDNPHGIKVNLPEGKLKLEFLFIQTPIEKIANSISLSGIIILILGIILSDKKYYGKKTS